VKYGLLEDGSPMVSGSEMIGVKIRNFIKVKKINVKSRTDK
jgi:hypothetical protein